MISFENILYIFEDSVDQSASIASAISLAKNNQASLTVLDVVPEVGKNLKVPTDGSLPENLQSRLLEDRRAQIHAFIAGYEDDIEIQVQVLDGIRFIEIIREAIQKGYDLLIKPAENPDYIERLFGSDDMHLLRKCPCPVWMMKAEETSNYKSIIAAIDINPYINDATESQLNEEILELASSLAVSDFANLHLVHAWDAPEAGFAGLWAEDPEETEKEMIESAHLSHQRPLQTLVKALRQSIGEDAYKYISPRIHLQRGSARDVIPAQVKELNADLVVMGTVARTGIPGLIIGNTAEEILDQIQCSVLAIKPAGFISPVTL